jgi:hypothetical protein
MIPQTVLEKKETRKVLHLIPFTMADISTVGLFLLFIIYYLLFIIYYLLSIIYYLLFTIVYDGWTRVR